ncbi:Ribosomal protein L11 methyltransferase [Fundidesulfovibrio magnetotacticus]|uniref:Ribosomal protein L11 methyltransferase n=1 Tax=Fundidesulfovibrio magnetotacticus TaxID=2730080 RepID=A0A6V8LYX0_9BACT|nr:50S ribosomal protein L11 methyltransferase [Fundidesulfovibrio magnetotacticus]GFK95990.1 Ribosomal protein L11 methyltransferase [Fundidesulfovibrio magnetotacticus]
MSQLLKIELTLPGSLSETDMELLSDDVSAWLSSNSLQGWEELTAPATRDVTFRFYLEPESPLAQVVRGYVPQRWPMARVAVEAQEQQDWAAAWKEFFTPIDIGGRFEIVPPWLSDADHHGLEPIVIEPKMAFGTGHHATTALCLEGIAKLVDSGRLAKGARYLDLGTGSGILAIGLAKLGCTGLAVDIDPQAVFCAAENLALNGLPAPGTPGAPVELCVCGLEGLAPDAAFDCIVANILAQPLIDMAPYLLAHLKPGGALILSGILTTQARAVADAYVRQGLPEPEIKDVGEWSGLFWV